MNRPSEAGYATVAVTTLLSGLSIIALAWQQLNLSSANRAAQTIATLEEDVQLEAAMNHVFAELLNGRISLNREGEWTGEVENGNAEISLVDDRVDINRADLDIIYSSLDGLSISEAARRTFESAVERQRSNNTGPTQFLDVLFSDQMSSQDIACLREHYTTFSTAASARARSNRQSVSLSGAVIEISVSASQSHQAGRGLTALALVTGNPQSPIMIADWRRYSILEESECPET